MASLPELICMFYANCMYQYLKILLYYGHPYIYIELSYDILPTHVVVKNYLILIYYLVVDNLNMFTCTM